MSAEAWGWGVAALEAVALFVLYQINRSRAEHVAALESKLVVETARADGLQKTVTARDAELEEVYLALDAAEGPAAAGARLARRMRDPLR